MNQDSKRTALIILRTPFQAWLAKNVLSAEQVSSFDLLYFTHNNTEEDRYSFDEIALRARKAQYYYAPVRRFDILGHLDFCKQAREWLHDKGNDLTILASIDAFVPNAIAQHQSGDLVTFDDGAANFFSSGLYHVDCPSWRGQIYRLMFGATDVSTIKKRIVRHYTVFPQFENIVGPDRLRILPGWNLDENEPNDGPVRTYFIGQPFEEALTTEQIHSFVTYVKTLNIDFYVRHPRERNPLDIGATMLDKKSRIAEEAIIDDAGDCNIHLVGWFSTVLFNLGAHVRKCTMVLFASDPKSSHMKELAERTGFETVML